ncbi:hypothetical protein ACFPYI_01260 [Halomarina salina]|uniref:DUF8027 domain-containing protein n=1 Tax=Halomarina salina TaxID=1872699 RepID=A0ABD5RID6_9EURY|nr:hypothetical protein [Halomarina salina]
MSIPGYDPADLDRIILARLDEDDLGTVLSPEQLRRYEAGEDLVDVLSEEEIRDVVGRRSKS